MGAVVDTAALEKVGPLRRVETRHLYEKVQHTKMERSANGAVRLREFYDTRATLGKSSSVSFQLDCCCRAFFVDMCIKKD